MDQAGPVRLTKFTHGLGCACKISPRILEEVLKEIPVPVHKDILVGANTSDDAAVYRINDTTAIVQSVDFFTPVIDDPFQFGAVAAANALSDIYAMGATPLFALNIVAFPNLRLPLEVLKKILEGANEVASEAGIFVLGGHTIEDNEPKFGMVVTGSVHPDKIIKNSTARPGDDLVLTKAIGTGILSTALKRGLVDTEQERALYRTMRTLNKKAAGVMLKYEVNACTDITGFGLLGHLREMCMASETGADVFAGRVPLLDSVYDLAAQGIIPGGTDNNMVYLKDSLYWEANTPRPLRVLLSDAQTSGGLLISIPSGQSEALVAQLHKEGISDATVIGTITPMKEHGVITIKE
ncbi:MAG TPA: selenide, water dikinase SelD [Bacteroidales bacterium]|nr:selenide, water dikinase SelD [Bacteroidales bacterium]